MLIEDFRNAIAHALDKGTISTWPGYSLPPNFTTQSFTEPTWNAYDWLTDDKGVTHEAPFDKPSFSTIESWFAAYQKELYLPDRLRSEVSRRITAAYGENDGRDEIYKRLSGDSTPEQDAERLRLLQVYKTLRDSIATLTQEQILSFDPSDDTHWRI